MANEQIQRYEMVSLTRCGDAWQELKADKDGDWISYDDHLAATTELREGQMHLAQEVDAKEEQIAALKAEVERANNSSESYRAGISNLRDRLAQREAEIERLSAPVSDEELEAIIGKALNPGDVSFQMAARQFADELILARKEGR